VSNAYTKQLMKILKGFLFLLILCLFNCDEDSNNPKFCNVNSIDNLDWLKKELDGYSGFSSLMDVSVHRAYYQGEEVIYKSICCPSCSMLPPEVRTCRGESLGRLGTDINPNLLTDSKTIWRTRNGICLGFD
jgi:hypothetical protein